jgi:Baseplate J-like protein
VSGLTYFCCEDRRRQALRTPGVATNGIDFLEVVDSGAAAADRQRVLRVSFVKPPSAPLKDPAAGGIMAADVSIEGGERVRNVAIVPPVTFDSDTLVVRVDAPGDFSTYTLRIARGGQPLPGMDPVLSAVDFSFKVECPSDFDCAAACRCAPEPFEEPEIDYIAKDYESFRRLLLDRMALLAPGWTERSPADLGVALIELLAYVGDHLSYQQDAIATEAYLGTARRRTSVRRHAAIVDYALHDGCNARTWVHVAVRAKAPAGDGVPLASGTPILVELPGRPAALRPVASAEDAEAVATASQTFETMHDALLFERHNEVRFHLWGQEDCCLPTGATRATLAGDLPHLVPGDVLVFEEVLGPRTGRREDADPRHRHPVRLVDVEHGLTDDLFEDPAHPGSPQPVTGIAWHAEDALPFGLCLSATTDAEHGSRRIDGVSVVRANVVLADHGRTVVAEPLGAPVAPRALLTAPAGACDRCAPRALVAPPPRFAPRLLEQPLTQAGRTSRVLAVGGRRERPFFDQAGSAASALTWEMEHVLPVVRLVDAGGTPWLPQRDLLSSDAFAPEFVAEIEEDWAVTLRFGDGEYGRRPAVGVALAATYRVGNGAEGNVGADSLRYVVVDDVDVADRIIAVRNPMAARGGTEPEPLERARQSAPAAFRRLQRAVTAEDYATLAERHPQIQRAQASVRWTGSWRTIFLIVDRRGGRPIDPAFENELRDHLEPLRMAGHDLEIDGPQFVALELEMLVCVEESFFNSDVERALLEALGSGRLPDGRRAAFHPDEFTFGQPVRLSAIYAAAQAVAGVAYVEITTLQRLGVPSRAALEDGLLRVGRLEIARLDNDPSFPERGVLRLTMAGGR